MEKELKDLKKKIKKYLGKCTPEFTPKVCKAIETEEGYIKIENWITSLWLHTGISISLSVHYIENNL